MSLDVLFEYANAGLAGCAVLVALLAARVKHTMGTPISMLVGSVFAAKHLGIYSGHLSVVPPFAIKLLGGYLLTLLFIRLKTLKPTRGTETSPSKLSVSIICLSHFLI